MPRNDSNQYYARWCCYRRPIRAAFARKGPFNSSSGYEENVARLKTPVPLTAAPPDANLIVPRGRVISSTWGGN